MLDLLESRHMEIPDRYARRKAKIILQREGYYNVINGYKRPFLLTTKPEQFRNGTTMDEVFALYAFDRTIRNIFLRSTLHVETNVKNLISCTFSSKYGHDNYLLYKNFDTKLKDAPRKVSQLIASVQSQLSSHAMDPNISHYLKNHGYIPLWVMNSIITFGVMSKFYSLMKQPDRQEVARVFKLQEHTLGNFLQYLSKIRNFCAHGNRLYCFKNKDALSDTMVHMNLSIPKDNGHFSYGRNDLFGAVIVLRYLLSGREFKRFYQELNGAINKLGSKLVTISIDDVLAEMGFPPNWKDIKQAGIRF